MHGLVDGGRSFMLGSSSRCVALEFSGQPHGGWADLFGCFLCNMLVHGGWCYGTQGYAHSCSWGYPDDVGLASMGLVRVLAPIWLVSWWSGPCVCLLPLCRTCARRMVSWHPVLRTFYIEVASRP